MTGLASPIPRFHLAVPVDDLDAARRFYGETLGLAQGRSADTWVDWNLHGHQLVTHLAPARTERIHNPVDGHDVPVPHFGLILTVDAFHQLADRLRAADTDFVIEPYVRFAGRNRRAVDDVPARPGRQRPGVQGVRRRLPGVRRLTSSVAGGGLSEGLPAYPNGQPLFHRRTGGPSARPLSCSSIDRLPNARR